MKKLIALILCFAFVCAVFAGCGTEKKAAGAGRVDVISSVPVVSDSETEPEPEPVYKKLTFAAVGDDIIYQAGFTDAKNRADGGRKYNFAPNYENIKEAISSADIAFINQETLMAGEEYGYSDYPRFNSPRELLTDLVDTGFDVISMANNHMLDMGTNGLADTIEFYKSHQEITMIGGYENETDFYTPRVVERDGIRIAFVAFTYATNGLKLAAGSDIYVPYIEDNDAAIEKSITEAKKVADLVFVSMHWGNENSFNTNELQRHAAQVAADSGAAVIIGHHPHVIQPVEWITGKNGNKMLCIYSLGDLVAVMMKSYNMLGGLMTFDIVQENEEFRIENPVFNPTVFHFGPSYYNGKIYYLKDFTDDLASTFGNVYNIRDGRKELESYVKKTIDEEFLPDYLKSQPETTN